MIDKQTVFEIHRLKNDKLSNRKIAEKLKIDRETVKKYLDKPQIVVKSRKTKTSILDEFKDYINEILSEDSTVSAVVIYQKLQDIGYSGKTTIIRDYLRAIRGKKKHRKAYIRFESKPGEQMQIDWGSFGTISYNETNRKLYALIVIESFSRKIYFEFTHSQKQEALHQCLFNAFCYFHGTPSEIVVDNMLTAVTKRQGRAVRFNGDFLIFLRPFKIRPIACNVSSPQEKGKVERAVGYIKINFMPLKKFHDLTEANNQALKWLNEIANVRKHKTTGQTPEKLFEKVKLTPLIENESNRFSETIELIVHKDFSIRFDNNSYTTPVWAVGKKLTVKASQTKIKIYHKEKLIATHVRCWERNKRIENELHVETVKKYHKSITEVKEIVVFISLGEEFREYLDGLIKANQPIKKSVVKLLSLKDEYGLVSLKWAILKAIKHGAYGSDYIINILFQEMTPESNNEPVKLKNKALNHIYLNEPSLEEYDALIF